MNFFKCQICGGELDIINNSPIAKCSCCGSKQTLPGTTGEDIAAVVSAEENNDNGLKGLTEKVKGVFSKRKEKKAAKKAEKEERKLAKLEAKGKSPKAKKNAKMSTKKKAIIIIAAIVVAIVLIIVFANVILPLITGGPAVAPAPVAPRF